MGSDSDYRTNSSLKGGWGMSILFGMKNKSCEDSIASSFVNLKEKLEEHQMEKEDWKLLEFFQSFLQNPTKKKTWDEQKFIYNITGEWPESSKKESEKDMPNWRGWGDKMEFVTEVTQSHYEVLVILGIVVTCIVVIYNVKNRRTFLHD